MSNGEISRVLAVQNPECSQPEVAEQVVGWLMDSKWADRLEVLRTRDPAEGSNEDLIRGALEPGTAVLILSGDGIGHDGFNAIIEADKAGEVSADEVSLLPVPAGSGNDLSRSLYGRNILRRHGRRLWDLMERGETAWMDAMRLEADGGQLDTYVHGYVGIGATGLSAAYINEQGFRERRRDTRLPVRALDAKEVMKSLLDAEPFEYRNGSDHTMQAHEMIFAIIPRIAAGVIRVDTHPFDGQAVSVKVAGRGFIPRAAVKVGSGLFGGAKAEVMDERQELTLRTPATIQYDGEPAELREGTVLTISHHRAVVRALI